MLENASECIDQSVQVGWNTRDLLLYAVGIGAKSADLSLAFGTWESFSFVCG